MASDPILLASSGRASGWCWRCSSLVAAAGIATTLMLPKQYTAESAMIVEMRIDPVLGALAPSLAAPGYMATQVDILRSERVASRVVKMLGVERSPSAVAQWREATSAKIPLERYFAGLLQRGLSVEPSQGSNVINVGVLGAGSRLRAGGGQRVRAGLHGRVGRPAGGAGAPVGHVPRRAGQDACAATSRRRRRGCRSSSRRRASSSPTSGSTRTTRATRP